MLEFFRPCLGTHVVEISYRGLPFHGYKVHIPILKIFWSSAFDNISVLSFTMFPDT